MSDSETIEMDHPSGKFYFEDFSIDSRGTLKFYCTYEDRYNVTELQEVPAHCETKRDVSVMM